MDMPNYKIKMLGKPEIIVNGQLDNSCRRKCRGIIYYLAASPGPVFREKLLEVFFPNSDVSSGKHNLNVHVSEIFRLFPGLVKSDATHLQISEFVDVDSKTLEHALSAEPLSDADNDEYIESLCGLINDFHGEFLDGFSLRGLSEFDNWVQSEREKTNSLYVSLLSTVAQERQKKSNAEDAINLLKKAVSLDPYDEYLYQQLMRAYARSGSPLKASKVYGRLRDILLDDLGVEPMENTKNLYNSILLSANTDTSLRSADRENMQTGLQGRNKLIEREQQYSECKKVFNDNSYRTVLIISKPGVGRSTFAECVSEEFPGIVIPIKCSNKSSNPLFSLKVALMSFQKKNEQIVSNLRSSMSKPVRSILYSLATSFAPQEDNSIQMLESPEIDQILDATIKFLQCLGSKNHVLIMIDDIEDASDDLRFILINLIRYLSLPNFSFLITKRMEHRIAELEIFFKELNQQNQIYKIVLPTLTLEGTKQLIKNKMADNRAVFSLSDEIVEWVYSRAVGNPEAVTAYADYFSSIPEHELRIDSLKSSNLVPDGLIRYLNQSVRQYLNVQRTPDIFRDMIRHAAVYGEYFDPDIIFKTLNYPLPDCIDAFEELVKIGLFKKASNNIYRFDYPILADAQFQELSPLRRQYIHEKIAETILNETEEIDIAAWKLIVKHYCNSRSYNIGLEYAMKYGSICTSLGDWDDANYFYDYLKHKQPLKYYALSIENNLLSKDFDKAMQLAEAGAKIDARFHILGSAELLKLLAELCKWRTFIDFFGLSISPEFTEPTLQLKSAVKELKPYVYRLGNGIINTVFQFEGSLYYGLYLYLCKEFVLAAEILAFVEKTNIEEMSEVDKRFISLSMLIRSLCLNEMNPKEAKEMLNKGIIYTRSNNLISCLPFYNVARDSLGL